jgi:hypothetical protein
MKENSSIHTGVLKTQDGRNFYLNPNTRLVELSKESTSLIAVNENGNLGIGGFNIELDFYIIQNKLYAEGYAVLRKKENFIENILDIDFEGTVNFPLWINY